MVSFLYHYSHIIFTLIKMVPMYIILVLPCSTVEFISFLPTALNLMANPWLVSLFMVLFPWHICIHNDVLIFLYNFAVCIQFFLMESLERN